MRRSVKVALWVGCVVALSVPGVQGQEGMRFRDPSLPIASRVADLVGRLTLEEKIGQMQNAAPAIPRLGIPAYDWWNEALHGVARAGRATIFPQAIGMAATFDPALIERVASAIADEARAKHHAFTRAGSHERYQGLTFWTPNINIYRDPRWGRGQETYGEDPFRSGQLGAAFVRGLQGSDPARLKAAACAKHYAVHSGPENTRHEFDARVSLRDLHETYLPAFRTLTEAGVESVMCAYNRLDGEPCCSNATLLGQILRKDWGFTGHVVSDCGAISDIDQGHKVTGTRMDSAIRALRAGTNLACGQEYTTLVEAVRTGRLSEAEIDASLSALLRTRFKLGLFDGDTGPFTTIPLSVVDSGSHRRLARETAAKSMVLLKNNGVLPLARDARLVYVTGPLAADVAVLLGNYNGTNAHLVTMLEGIAGAAGPNTVVEYRQGALLDRPNLNKTDWSVGLARRADVTIAVLGNSPLLEGEEGESIASPENGDRADIGLPSHQVEFLERLRKAARKLVVVLTGGGPIAAPRVHELADAVVFAWYPGQEGGAGLADVLFGDVSPSGRLPVTFPASLAQLPGFDDYRMTGRTYRYMTEEPLYPFGFGLGYTSFRYALEDAPASLARDGRAVVRVRITNTGTRAGDETAQLYVTGPGAGDTRPIVTLRGVQRVSLAAGESRVIELPLQAGMFARVDEQGTRVIDAGAHTVIVGGSSPGARATALGAPEPVRATVAIKP